MVSLGTHSTCYESGCDDTSGSPNNLPLSILLRKSSAGKGCAAREISLVMKWHFSFLKQDQRLLLESQGSLVGWTASAQREREL